MPRGFIFDDGYFVETDVPLSVFEDIRYMMGFTSETTTTEADSAYSVFENMRHLATTPPASQASHDIAEDAEVYDLLACPITFLMLERPCVLAGDTQTYSKEAISSWINKHGTSPMNREPVSPTFIPNKLIQKMIDFYKTNPNKKNIEDYFAAHPEDFLKGELIITHNGNTYEKKAWESILKTKVKTEPDYSSIDAQDRNQRSLVRNRLAEHVMAFYQEKVVKLDPKTQLRLAIAENNKEKILKALVSNPNFFFDVNENGENILETSYKQNKHNVIAAFFEFAQKEPNTRLKTFKLAGMRGGLTPLHLAAGQTDLKMAAYCLEQNPDYLNAVTDHKNTPLHSGVIHSNAEFVQFLIIKGADINLQNNSGNTALHKALLRDDDVLVKLLMSVGARCDIRNNKGLTPVGLANQSEKMLPIFAERFPTIALYLAAKQGNDEKVLDVLRKNKDLVKNEVFISSLRAAHEVKSASAVNALLSYLFDELSDAEINEMLKGQHKLISDVADVLINAPHIQPVNARLLNFLKKNDPKYALYDATLRDDDETVTRLLQGYPELFSNQLLTIALNKKNLHMVNILLSNAINLSDETMNMILNFQDNRNAALLHLAAEEDNIELMKLCIKRFPPLLFNGWDKFKKTPLQYAVSAGKVDAVKLLLSPNVPLDLNAQDDHGNTALHDAVKKNQLEIVALLLQCGASYHLQNNEGLSALDLAKQNPDVMAIFNEKLPELPLINAVNNDDYDAIVKLLRDSPDLFVNVLNRKHINLLQQAFAEDKFNAVKALLEFCLHPGQVIENMFSWTFKGNATLLHLAVESGSYESVQRLLESGVNINTFDLRGLAPLHYAAEKGFTSIVELLLSQNNIVIDQKDWKDETPLYKAIYNNKVDVAKLLLDAHADFTLANNAHNSPYAWARLTGQGLQLINTDSYWLKLREDADKKSSEYKYKKAYKIDNFLDSLSAQDHNHKVSELEKTIKGENDVGKDLCRRMHSRFFTRVLPKKKVAKHLKGLLKEMETPTLKR